MASVTSQLDWQVVRKYSSTPYIDSGTSSSTFFQQQLKEKWSFALIPRHYINPLNIPKTWTGKTHYWMNWLWALLRPMTISITSLTRSHSNTTVQKCCAVTSVRLRGVKEGLLRMISKYVCKNSLWGVVVGGFVVVGALIVQVTPGASQLIGVVRHGQSVRGDGHVVHLRPRTHFHRHNKVSK